MIKSIWIDNFKSLVDFRLELSHFNCLVGLNGAGKSTVLQAMDFIAQLMKGDIDGWLKQRQWEVSDINSKLTRKQNIDFKVWLSHELLGNIVWSGSINRVDLRCTSELVEVDVGGRDQFLLLKVEDAHFSFSHTGSSELVRAPIVFDYQGSILSQLKNSQLNAQLQHLKKEITYIRSLDLLSPELLRAKTRTSEGNLGLGGEKLAAFVHESGKRGKDRLQAQLSGVYKQLDKIETKSLTSGWKQLGIVEEFNKHKLTTVARHMNDGMLRLMAILSQLDGEQQFLLFDEIENGINPELVEFLVDHLVVAESQIMVTTHSPMILNFLEDDVARESITYLYKNSSGHTKSIRLFDIPSLNKKLAFMGPGEAFVDTDLTHLQDEIISNNKAA